MYEILQSKTQAMKMLDALPARWPGAETLRRSEAFKIRKLVEQGRTKQAIAEVDKINKQYPREARELLRLVIRQVRRRINDLRDTAGKQQELSEYQENYYRLAQELFRPLENKPIEQRYQETRMYADGLVQHGSPVEALRLFRQCSSLDEKNRKVKADEITERFADKLAAVKAAAGNPGRLDELKNNLAAMTESSGIDATRFSRLLAVSRAWDSYRNAKPGAKKLERLSEFGTRYLSDGFATLCRLQVNAIAVDAQNVLGLARAHHGVGDLRKREKQPQEAEQAYREALKHYARVLRGIDPNENPALYWRTQQQYCQCVLAGFSDSAKTMSGLVVRIRQLKLKNPLMGGLYPRFNAIEADAKRLHTPRAATDGVNAH